MLSCSELSVWEHFARSFANYWASFRSSSTLADPPHRVFSSAAPHHGGFLSCQTPASFTFMHLANTFALFRRALYTHEKVFGSWPSICKGQTEEPYPINPVIFFFYTLVITTFFHNFKRYLSIFTEIVNHNLDVVRTFAKPTFVVRKPLGRLSGRADVSKVSSSKKIYHHARGVAHFGLFSEVFYG